MRRAALSLVFASFGCLGPCRPTTEPTEPPPVPGTPAEIAVETGLTGEIPTDSDAGEAEDSDGRPEAAPPAPPKPKARAKKERKKKKKARPHPPDGAPGGPDGDPDPGATPTTPGEAAEDGAGEGGEDGADDADRKKPLSPRPAGIEQVGPRSWTVSRRLFERWQDNPYALGDVDEHGDGWELKHIRRRQAYHLGMRSKDVVYTVNGKRLDTKARLIAAYMLLKGKEDFDVEFERSGVRMVHHYRVVGSD